MSQAVSSIGHVPFGQRDWMRLSRVAGAIVALCALALISVSAHAVPIASDITVTGSVTYDTAFSESIDAASHSGTMTATVGGATTTTTYADGTSAGANPLTGSLTDIGDGFGMTGLASATGDVNGDGEFAIGIDLLMTIANASLTDTYQVTLQIVFDNSADSSGPDAYVDSEFTVDSRLSTDPAPGTEEFFTHVVTDTLDTGGPVSESGIDTIVLTLNPGATLLIEGDWTMDGGAYEDSGDSLASLDNFNASITVSDVENITEPPDPTVPAPATLALLSGGLFGLAWARRRQ